MSWLAIDTGLWIALAVVWIAAAPFAKKTTRREPLALRLRYLALGAVAGVLLSDKTRIAWLAVKWVPQAPWVGPVAVGVTACGIGFALWARWTLGRNWSGTVTVKEEHELVQRGPYGVTRHPIYTGGVVAYLGTAVVIGTVGAVVAVVPLGIALWMKMKVEERFMGEVFGDAYAAYRKRVKGIVPYAW